MQGCRDAGCRDAGCKDARMLQLTLAPSETAAHSALDPFIKGSGGAQQGEDVEQEQEQRRKRSSGGHRLCGSISLAVNQPLHRANRLNGRQNSRVLHVNGPPWSCILQRLGKQSAREGGREVRHGITGSTTSCRSYLMKWTPFSHNHTVGIPRHHKVSTI
uniref:HDC13253 n=1 Tax=Drosophila melanogaster TaxID=7227 RepID=Q6IK71_DROME|nr:TPA_inf: HDC13253 [Drosophila melanogaster]